MVQAVWQQVYTNLTQIKTIMIAEKPCSCGEEFSFNTHSLASCMCLMNNFCPR